VEKAIKLIIKIEGGNMLKKEKTKLIITGILLLFLCSLLQVFADPCGDVDSNGTINIVDALLIAQFYVNLDPPDFDEDAADVSGDGAITILDALLIAQFYVNLIQEFEGCITPTPTPTGDGSCGSELIGYAAVPGDGVNTTTGGGNADPVVVTTLSEFKAAAQDSEPRVVVVSGTIRTTEESGYPMEVASNKTIMGADKNATIYGGLTMVEVSNVIIRNLNIQGTYPNPGPGTPYPQRILTISGMITLLSGTLMMVCWTLPGNLTIRLFPGASSFTPIPVTTTGWPASTVPAEGTTLRIMENSR
jgi:hypothetical protein